VKKSIITLIVMVAIFFTLILYSHLVEPNMVRISEVEVYCISNCSRYVDVRIVQLSDLHLRDFSHREVEVINLACSVKPNIIVLTGDLVDDPNYLKVLEEFVKELRRTCPRIVKFYAVFGNWEYWSGTTDRVEKILENCGVKVLINSNDLVEVKSVKLWIVGIDDPVTHHDNVDEAFRGLNSSLPIIVITHAPGIADEVVKKYPKTCLILAGHTHGGQIVLPLLGPIYVPEGSNHYISGMYRIGNTTLYVSRGIGTYKNLPLRLLSPPEIVLIHLKLCIE